MKLPLVAIIGQSNAGKSSLFNRLTRSRQAIVAREAGTTRDSVFAVVDDRYLLADTAGLKNPDDAFEANIQEQIEDAANGADFILIVVDGTKYPNQDDRFIAKKALKSGKPTLLVINKTDLKDCLPDTEFLCLGLKHSLRVSAGTGHNLDALRTAIDDALTALGFVKTPTATAKSPHATKTATDATTTIKTATDTPLKIALIGRPNVGKSSLFNRLAQKQQAIVADRAGTTRDVNRVRVRYKNRTLELLDTAGLRKPGKRAIGVEKFSALRTLSAIEESDLCCLLIDATETHSKFDQSLAGQITDAGKGIILIVAKADLMTEKRADVLDRLSQDFNFVPYAPVIFTSAVTGKNATRIFELALAIDRARKTVFKTADLNRLLQQAVSAHPPAGLKNTRPKLRYMVQTDSCPPWFVVYGSDLKLLHWSYKRYLERRLREAYPLVGTPICFSFRNG